MTLKTAATDDAAFVVIDAESWGADYLKPAEIDISLLPPLHTDFSYFIYTLPKT